MTKNQRPWYKPTNQMTSAARILVPRSFNDSFVIYHNPHGFLSLRFYRLHLREGREASLIGFLNTTLIAFFLEILGNKSLGQGVLDFFMADFLALRIPVIETRDLEAPFAQLKNHPIGSVWEEYGMAAALADNTRKANPSRLRKDLDDVVFDALHLTRGERDAIYQAVVESVEARLTKATSLSPKPLSKRIEAVDKTRGIWADLPEEENGED